MSTLFGGIRQLAMVVRDAEATMREWSESLGVGPFYVLHDFEVQEYRYRGRPEPSPILTLGFAQSGPLQVEIIQQHNDARSAYRDFLDSGREGCQHVCAWLASPQEYDAKRTQLLDAGFTIVHEGASKTPRARFAYFETNLPGALMFEISEAQLPVLRPLFELSESSAATWDGTDSIRSISVG